MHFVFYCLISWAIISSTRFPYLVNNLQIWYILVIVISSNWEYSQASLELDFGRWFMLRIDSNWYPNTFR